MSRNRARLAGVLLGLAACAAPEPLPVVRPGTTPPRALLPLTLRFEPPLANAARLTILHESGWRWSGEVAPTGADLQAPFGPANLLLELATPQERLVSVRAEMAPVVWRIPKE